MSFVDFSLTLGYGGNHAYPANSGFSWADAMLQTQADVSIQVHIEGKEIERVDCSKSLGLTIDETLSWSNKYRKHVEENLLRNWRLESSETIYQHTFRRGTLGGTQYRNTVRKNGKYRNTASKIVQIPIPHILITFIIGSA